MVWWFYNHKRIIIVSADEKILKILLFKEVKVYEKYRLFCEKPISNIEELELEVEKHENIVLNEVSKWTES